MWGGRVGGGVRRGGAARACVGRRLERQTQLTAADAVTAAAGQLCGVALWPPDD